MTLTERINSLGHREARVALAVLARLTDDGTVEWALNHARRHIDKYPDDEER